jgi:molybdopterin-dependent oxidoreductase alpha subunit
MRDDDDSTVHYDGPTGGWGSVKGITQVFAKERPRPGALETLQQQNKPGGFMCVSCAWTKPASPHPFEFCENGAKATLWELTSRRCTPDFFARHSVSELKTWRDYDLEQAGRLTHPMRYDRASDKYVPVSWSLAFAEIGRELKALDPKSTVFYTSGRASLETSYLWALFARLYGHNNLPDSSNMCHETTSVGLKKVIGSPVGTCVLPDFEKCDAIFFFGQNTGSNSPRFLHPLQEAVRRGCKIVTFNPVKEKGLIAFTNPQSPIEMATGKQTRISDLYFQVRPSGDIAAIMGLCKHVLARDEQLWAAEQRHVLDVDFIKQHTKDFDAFADRVRATSWEEIEQESGLSRAELEAAGDIYCDADNVIGVYGMGVTQHVGGSETIGMIVNLLLMRGNMGREGAGISPVRGHSNVQGQRTVGITEKPELGPTPERLKTLFQVEAPTEKGWDTVESCRQIIAGTAQGFIQLGGNFLRAVPEHAKMKEGWARLPIAVHIATKLNKSHLTPSKETWLLPCLGRLEEDWQETGRQAVTMEDSFSHIYGSIGKATPASRHLLSEPAIVAGLAKAVLPENLNVPWDKWVGNYGLVRTAIENTWPDKFANYNERMFEPGGFWKGNPAAHRKWETESGKAEFNVPRAMNAAGFADAEGRFRLVTLRSNDQFNTTVYGYDDRFRGIKGTRHVAMMNARDIAAFGLTDGDTITLESDAEDGVERVSEPLRIVEYNIPAGCIGGYYPELNCLIPVEHHALDSHVPAGKTVPVRVRA